MIRTFLKFVGKGSLDLIGFGVCAICGTLCVSQFLSDFQEFKEDRAIEKAAKKVVIAIEDVKNS